MSLTHKPRLIVLTCVWKRPVLTSLVLRSYQRTQQLLADELNLCLLAVGSEGDDSRSLCQQYGFDYVEHANSPLSHKWNAGVQAVRNYDVDGLVIVGSDDLLSSNTFGIYAEKLSEGLDFFGISDLYFYNALSGVLGYWGGYALTQPQRVGEPIGCGRCLSRRLLDRVDWNLWPAEPGYEKGLDLVALRLAKVQGFQPSTWRMAELGIKAVDVKAGDSITAFEEIGFEQQSSGEAALEYLREWWSQEELKQLARLIQMDMNK